MSIFPPIPAWDASHPIAVHLPLGLLFVAPVFVVLALATKDRVSRTFDMSALVLMFIGTVGAFLAVMTGEAAEDILQAQTPVVEAAVEAHEELGELVRTLFAVLTAVFAAILFVPRLIKPELKQGVRFLMYGVFLAGYLASVVVLANVGHQGGVLVHGHGVLAPIPVDTNGASASAAQDGPAKYDDDDDDDDDD